MPIEYTRKGKGHAFGRRVPENPPEQAYKAPESQPEHPAADEPQPFWRRHRDADDASDADEG